MTWATFASNVNNGISTYNGKTVYLDEDISIVNEMVGTSDYPFRGTFNGQNHTLTVDITSTESYTAPFHFVNGAIIENLIVEGEVKSTSRHSSGLVGNLLSTKTITIQNCLINTNVGTSSTNSDYCGGIIGHSHDGDITIIGSAYTGTLTVNGNNLTGGLIGWGDTPTRVSVSNSIFAGNYNGNGYFHPVGCANHANSISSSAITISNCYFTVDATSNFSSGNTDKPIDQKASNKGKHAYTITGDEGITVTMNGTSTIYDISGIEAYNVGVVYDGQIIAGSGDNVSLNISGSENGYLATYGSISGSGPYTLAMASNNTIIKAAPSSFITEISTSEQWEEFCFAINIGHNYSGDTVTLTDDITISKMAGTSKAISFQGTFDGQGHTLTLSGGDFGTSSSA